MSPRGHAWVWWTAFAVIPALVAAAQVASKVLGIGIFQTILENWFRYDSAPVYFMTMGLFVAVVNVEIKKEKMANAIRFVAPLTFGVYLIHNHADVSSWIWEILNLPAKMESPLFPLIQLSVVLGIFAVCIAIDAARKATVGKLEEHSALDALCTKVTETVCRTLERII